MDILLLLLVYVAMLATISALLTFLLWVSFSFCYDRGLLRSREFVVAWSIGLSFSVFSVLLHFYSPRLSSYSHTPSSQLLAFLKPLRSYVSIACVLSLLLYGRILWWFEINSSIMLLWWEWICVHAPCVDSVMGRVGIIQYTCMCYEYLDFDMKA